MDKDQMTESETTKERLKPCPFCGESKLRRQNETVGHGESEEVLACGSCSARGPTRRPNEYHYLKPGELEQLWNHRAPAPSPTEAGTEGVRVTIHNGQLWREPVLELSNGTAFTDEQLARRDAELIRKAFAAAREHLDGGYLEVYEHSEVLCDGPVTYLSVEDYLKSLK